MTKGVFSGHCDWVLRLQNVLQDYRGGTATHSDFYGKFILGFFPQESFRSDVLPFPGTKLLLISVEEGSKVRIVLKGGGEKERRMHGVNFKNYDNLINTH